MIKRNFNLFTFTVNTYTDWLPVFFLLREVLWKQCNNITHLSFYFKFSLTLSIGCSTQSFEQQHNTRDTYNAQEARAVHVGHASEQVLCVGGRRTYEERNLAVYSGRRRKEGGCAAERWGSNTSSFLPVRLMLLVWRPYEEEKCVRYITNWSHAFCMNYNRGDGVPCYCWCCGGNLLRSFDTLCCQTFQHLH